jgi:hypothetical protein
MWARSNIYDPIHRKLDQHIFDGDSPRPSFVAFVKHLYYKNVAALVPTPEKYLPLVLTGSLTTYQYSTTSDCDVSVFPDYKELQKILFADPDDIRKELIAISIGKTDGTFIPGTMHPMQLFVVPPNIAPEDLYKPGLRSGWSFEEKRWIVPPEKGRSHRVQKEFPDLYEKAAQMADKMSEMLDHDPEKARQLWKQIHKKRQLDEAAGLGDFSEGNVVYKFLLHQGLFERIGKELGEHIAKIAVVEWDPENEPGLPRPIFDNMPVPYTTEVNSGGEPAWREADQNRLAECWTQNLCIVCGLPLADPVSVFCSIKPNRDLGQAGQIVDGGLHPRCAALTKAHCPHIRDYIQNYELHQILFEYWEGMTAEHDDRSSVGTLDLPSDAFHMGKTAADAEDHLPSEDKKFFVIYDFEADQILLGLSAKAKSRAKVIGTYDGRVVTLHRSNESWLNANYFKRLWLTSFPTRPLAHIFFHDQGEIKHLKDRDDKTSNDLIQSIADQFAQHAAMKWPDSSEGDLDQIVAYSLAEEFDLAPEMAMAYALRAVTKLNLVPEIE